MIICGSIIFLFTAHAFLRQLLRDYPLSTGSELLLNMMNDAMQSVHAQKPELFTVDRVDYSSEGAVRSIQCDTAAITAIKTDFTANLRSIVSNYGNDLSIAVPFGTLIGSEYTVGFGPDIHFKLRFSTTFNTRLNSKFIDAGVNNTLHRITMTVEGEIYIVIPWSKCSQTVTTDYILSETVIVGAVPEAFTQVIDGSGDVIGDIFDYGAELEEKDG